MLSKYKKLYYKYKNDNYSPRFGSFFNDNSSLDSIVSYDNFSDNIIEIEPLNIPDAIEAQNVNIYEQDNLLNDNNSDISDETNYQNLMEFYDNPKKIYISYFFILLIWILQFTIKNNESLIFYTVTIYPQCQDIRNQVWRLLSNNLVHSNFGHLLSNSIFLFPLLIMNEYMIDKKYLLFIFLINSLNSNFFFYYLNPYKGLLGSSGIVFGLMSIILSNMTLNFDSFLSIHKILIFLLNILIFLFEFLSYFSNKNDRTAYCIHWFSYISCLILSNSILPIKNLSITKIYYRSLNILLYLFGTIFLIINYSYWPNYSSYNELFQKQDIDNCCYELFTFLKKNESNSIDDFKCNYST